MSAFTDAVDRGLQGMTAVSSGTCPGCHECMEIDGYKRDDDGCLDDAREAHKADWHSKDMASGEHSFSWRPCGVCGSTLGGNRNHWHWIDVNDTTHSINHENDMCDDCVFYLANGDEPESWEE
jgi:hypothetical protein